MSRKALVLSAISVGLGALFALVSATASCPSSAHPSAGDPRPRAHTPDVARRPTASRPPADRRRSPSLARTPPALRISEATRGAPDPWQPTADQLAPFAPEAQPHVVSVAAYLNDVFAPRLTDCVRPFEPTGWMEVRHSFYVDKDGLAHPGQVDGMSTATVELLDSDLEPADAQRVVQCMELAALDSSFVHVPLFEQNPELGFVTYQGYQFGSAQ